MKALDVSKMLGTTAVQITFQQIRLADIHMWSKTQHFCTVQTDHDPRNPAYIATQGPLPHTAPDFWQMVWEQGSVVMVMLTRLTENGTAMCHRYWPEEGSELYHIYEVKIFIG